MLNKIKNFVVEKKNALIGSAVAAGSVIASAPAVFAADETVAYTFSATDFAPITQMITANIPVLLGVVVSILALTLGIPWCIKFVKRFIK